jgi:hypothetical protein
MRGTNTLRINNVTMMEALQEYFDARYKPKLKVTGARATQQGMASNEFEVTLEEIKESGGEPK